MTANELLILRTEMLSIREILTTCPDAALSEVESRLDAVAESIARRQGIASPVAAACLPKGHEVVRDIHCILGDLAALCEQAAEFYGNWLATLGSLAGEYDGTGVPAFPPLQQTRVTARG